MQEQRKAIVSTLVGCGVLTTILAVLAKAFGILDLTWGQTIASPLLLMAAFAVIVAAIFQAAEGVLEGFKAYVDKKIVETFTMVRNDTLNEVEAAFTKNDEAL